MNNVKKRWLQLRNHLLLDSSTTVGMTSVISYRLCRSHFVSAQRVSLCETREIPTGYRRNLLLSKVQHSRYHQEQHPVLCCGSKQRT